MIDFQDMITIIDEIILKNELLRYESYFLRSYESPAAKKTS